MSDHLFPAGTAGKLIKGNVHQQLPGLSNEDRTNYIVSIDQKAIKTPHSTSFDPNFPSKKMFADLVLNVENKSKDTLKFMEMWCAWPAIIKADNPELHVRGNNCTQDHPIVNSVPPNSSTRFVMSVVFNKDKVQAGSSFKIGLGIFKFIGKQQLQKFDPAASFAASGSANIIWSNTVVIPK